MLNTHKFVKSSQIPVVNTLTVLSDCKVNTLTVLSDCKLNTAIYRPIQLKMAATLHWGDTTMIKLTNCMTIPTNEM